MEYETIWNGVHGNADRDLLCVSPYSPKDVAAPAMVKRKRTTRAEALSFVLEVLPTTRREALTIREIRAKTGCSEDQVALALSRIRKDGSLLTAGECPPRVYWRKA